MFYESRLRSMRQPDDFNVDLFAMFIFTGTHSCVLRRPVRFQMILWDLSYFISCPVWLLTIVSSTTWCCEILLVRCDAPHLPGGAVFSLFTSHFTWSRICVLLRVWQMCSYDIGLPSHLTLFTLMPGPGNESPHLNKHLPHLGLEWTNNWNFSTLLTKFKET